MSVDSGVEPRVSIYWDDSGAPGGSVGAPLTNPTGIDGSTATVEEFTTTGIILYAGMPYWVVVEKASGTGSVRLRATSSTADDTDPRGRMGRR